MNLGLSSTIFKNEICFHCSKMFEGGEWQAIVGIKGFEILKIEAISL